jgi:low temperature requirement protein LtrA
MIIRKALAKTGYKIALCMGFSKMEKNVHFIVADRADNNNCRNRNWHNLFQEDSVSVS